MLMKPFYQVPQNCYLFGKGDKPEEKVRQWVLFELMSTYGVPLNNIRIEHNVKFARGNQFADIVVFNGVKPIAVIECKPQTFSDHDVAMEQAKDYAYKLQTQMVAYTNGLSWRICKRHALGYWEVADDFDFETFKPSSIRGSSLDIITLNQLTETTYAMCYWMGDKVPATYSHKFLSLLQIFTLNASRDSFLDKGTQQLLAATLELLSFYTLRGGWADLYNDPQFNRAISSFNAYSSSRFNLAVGNSNSQMLENISITRLLAEYEAILARLFVLGVNYNWKTTEVYSLRLLMNLVSYFGAVQTTGRFLELSNSIVGTVIHFLNIYMQEHGFKIEDITNYTLCNDNSCLAKTVYSDYWENPRTAPFFSFEPDNLVFYPSFGAILLEATTPEVEPKKKTKLSHIRGGKTH